MVYIHQFCFPHEENKREIYTSEASLIIVPDFTISVYGSLGNFLFSPSFSLLWFRFLFTGLPKQDGMPRECIDRERKEERMGQKKRA